VTRGEGEARAEGLEGLYAAALPKDAPGAWVRAAIELTGRRGCRDCGALIEYDGDRWVDVAIGGTFDICPARYDESTDTDHGHRPSPIT
jgi:hypothetical protein